VGSTALGTVDGHLAYELVEDLVVDVHAHVADACSSRLPFFEFAFELPSQLFYLFFARLPC